MTQITNLPILEYKSITPPGESPDSPLEKQESVPIIPKPRPKRVLKKRIVPKDSIVKQPEVPVPALEPPPRLVSPSKMSLKSLETQTISHDDEHEFAVFGRQVGLQLQKMPLKEALETQLIIQRVLTEQRLGVIYTSKFQKVSSCKIGFPTLNL